jgi:hypothetical protein
MMFGMMQFTCFCCFRYVQFYRVYLCVRENDCDVVAENHQQAFNKQRSVTKIRYEMTRESSQRQLALKDGVIRPFCE